MVVQTIEGTTNRRVDAGARHAVLAAWRTLSPGECLQTEVVFQLDELAEIMTSMCRARSCDAEIAGSVSHAIGRALKSLNRPSALEAAVDLSMSLVLRHALRGDPTARVLILFALKRTCASAELIEDWRRWRSEEATARLVDRSTKDALQ